MALAACFGGPMVNILLGVGTAAVSAMSHRGSNGDAVEIQISSKSIMVSTACLLFNTLVYVVIVPRQQYRMTRAVGLAAMAVYFVGMTGSPMAGPQGSPMAGPQATGAGPEAAAMHGAAGPSGTRGKGMWAYPYYGGMYGGYGGLYGGYGGLYVDTATVLRRLRWLWRLRLPVLWRLLRPALCARLFS
ncbi:hypothetical protein DL89DRAFT_298313 [Linderina pennispora]|uniref:Sodium/calcium exchanger membrane region domain-containing protein n=1 Tax=Linderina pennispora TaxID=61395 RepID=A0A1Y1VQL1_9FUNG|nr:uncharacterized protein DL89DRAFT_298313 [Linderina pennispora]ORX63559.1 hypothetical protein DL89DRAFT_298313 [Linderina pennispora]